MKIYIASDHGGFKLKEKVKEYLAKFHLDVTDMGPFELKDGDDYPDYALPLSAKVAQEKNSKGILICRNGVGVCIAANKISGVRAALSWSVKHAESTRTDDDTNVLCLPADYIDGDEAIKVVSVWLNTNFSNDERHKRRINKVKNFEENE